MNRRFFCALILILALGAPARAAGLTGAAADYVRLHVVADSDAPAAQALKLRVRDAVLDGARQLLADCADADAAWRTVNDNLGTLSAAARSCARGCGWTGAVRAETGVYMFPERQYGGVVVPAGEYRALRVVIGSGSGRNWWCVLFPSLCMPEECAPGEPVRFHSSILRWLRALFGGAA